MNDEIKHETSNEKLLGVIVNNNLTWKNHLFGNDEEQGLVKKLSQRIGILCKLRKYLPDKKFTQIAEGLFMSKLIYGITVWGFNLTKEEIRKLQVLQNKTLRLISGMEYGTPTSSLLKATNMLSVHQLVAYHTACLIFKIKQSKLPSYHYNRLFPEAIRDNQAGTRCDDSNIHTG